MRGRGADRRATREGRSLVTVDRRVDVGCRLHQPVRPVRDVFRRRYGWRWWPARAQPPAAGRRREVRPEPFVPRGGVRDREGAGDDAPGGLRHVLGLRRQGGHGAKHVQRVRRRGSGESTHLVLGSGIAVSVCLRLAQQKKRQGEGGSHSYCRSPRITRPLAPALSLSLNQRRRP